MSQFKKRILDPIEDTFLLDIFFDRRTRPFFIYVAIIIAIGAVLYHWLEGWEMDRFFLLRGGHFDHDWLR